MAIAVKSYICFASVIKCFGWTHQCQVICGWLYFLSVYCWLCWTTLFALLDNSLCFAGPFSLLCWTNIILLRQTSLHHIAGQFSLCFAKTIHVSHHFKFLISHITLYAHLVLRRKCIMPLCR